MNRIYYCFALIIISTLLSSCASFEVRKQYNELRNETVCEMEKNIIYGESKSGSYNFDFDLVNSTFHNNKNSVKMLALSSAMPIGFQKNAILMLTLNNSDKFKLTASDGKNKTSTQFHYAPGYVSNGVYIPGYAYNSTIFSSVGVYQLSNAEWSKILDAKTIDVAVELQNGDNVKGSFSESNFENLNRFKAECK